MKWKVNWLPGADAELTTIRSRAADPLAVEYAALEIDRPLETNPQGVGESRDQGRRVLFTPPPGVTYRVFALSREVDVLHVWQTKKV